MGSGKCTVRKEGDFWIGSCFVEGEKMKVIRNTDFDVIEKYARDNDLRLEVVDKLRTKKEGSIFNRG